MKLEFGLWSAIWTIKFRLGLGPSKLEVGKNFEIGKLHLRIGKCELVIDIWEMRVEIEIDWLLEKFLNIDLVSLCVYFGHDLFSFSLEVF